jgi:hypothetical protein
MTGNIWADCVQLLKSWWSVDRVRVSVDEGRLLRIEPPCVIVVGARPAEVWQRTTVQSAAGPLIIYDCQSTSGSCQLQVTPRGKGVRPSVCWTDEQTVRYLSPEDVEVYQPRKR